ncbi:SgcJ/EcaC family oxidoreductase [Algihabitans albus]|uniref:YybH family protein n=1 Tax=Algihabitans albus TaxID=2164067 RepID=UPI0035CFA320
MTGVTRPEDMSPALAEAFNAADLDAVMALYEPQAVLVDETGQPHAGIEAIRTALAELLTGGGTMTSRPRFAIVAGDVAVSSAAWQLETVAANGETVQATGCSLEILRRQANGRWRYAIDCPAGQIATTTARPSSWAVV